jgi:hypothetical protein
LSQTYQAPYNQEYCCFFGIKREIVDAHPDKAEPSARDRTPVLSFYQLAWPPGGNLPRSRAEQIILAGDGERPGLVLWTDERSGYALVGALPEGDMQTQPAVGRSPECPRMALTDPPGLHILPPRQWGNRPVPGGLCPW